MYQCTYFFLLLLKKQFLGEIGVVVIKQMNEFADGCDRGVDNLGHGLVLTTRLHTLECGLDGDDLAHVGPEEVQSCVVSPVLLIPAHMSLEL